MFKNISNNNNLPFNIISYLYILLLLFAAFTIIPYVDTYYYWLWSNNLQISYLDGPPMIAYIIRMSTDIFGSTVFAVNLVGTIIAIITFYIIKQITQLLTSSNSYGTIIGTLWITSYAIVAHRIVTFVTYDCLVNLFELTTILFVLMYLKTKYNRYIYLIGFSGGLALLSKYSAIVVLASIILYFISVKELRSIYKHIHIYISILICTLIFLPVLIWNMLNNWASFHYQLIFHTVKDKTIIDSIMYYIKSAVFGPLIPLIGIFVIVILINVRKQQPNILLNQLAKLHYINFLYFILGGVFIFWFVMSTHYDIPDRYMLLFYSILTIIIGTCLALANYKKLLIFFIIANMGWSIGNIVSHSLKIKNPTCFSKYIDSNRLKFSSPFRKYIKPTPDASDFCYLEKAAYGP